MMRKRFLLSALLLFALVLAPSLSLADDGFGGSVGGGFDGDYGVKYTTVTHDGGWTGFLVKAADSWSAAVYACGGDPARISADVRSKLSDPNYGGAFYMYATNYAHIMSVYEIPEFVPLYVLAGLGISSVWHGEFGDMMLWYADTPNSLLESAMFDFRRVLAGDDLGGGGSTVPLPDDYLAFSFTTFNWRLKDGSKDNILFINAKSATFSDGVLSVGSGTRRVSPWGSSNYYFAGGRFYVSPDVVEFANGYLNQGYQVVFIGALSGGNGRPFSNFVGGLVYGHDISFSNASPNGYDYVTQLYGSDLHNVTFGTSDVYYDTDGVFCFISGDVSSDVSIISGSRHQMFTSAIIEPFYAPPSGDWPEPSTPVTPDPPEIPTPTAPTTTTDPTIVEPTVTWPDITISVQPTPDTTDHSVLLKAINDNLNSLRSDLLIEFEGVEQGLRNIYQYLQHLDSLFERHCKHIRDSIDDNFYELELYLKGLFEWLPEQLKFDSVYDDSAVVDWLRQIYYKLGGGTYAPNPVADPGGFFGWLGGLVAGFLASLLAGLPGKIQELLSDLSDLTGYFPFSAPWDLYALLALFSHDPVTPVFTLPWGLGGGHTVNVVVDCSQWDGVMSIIRSVEKIIFAGGLAKLTFDMFKPNDVTGD